MQELKFIQAIVFDLDGTLRHSQPTFNQKFLEVAHRLGVQDTPAGRHRSMRWLHYYWAQSPEMLRDKEYYADQVEAFWSNHARLALEALGCAPRQAADLAPSVYELMTEEFEPQDWVPQEVPPSLEALQSAGFRLAVLSNRTNPFWELLEKLGLDGYFEFALAAGELEAWKPDPLIFTHALERMATRPEEVLYVGDNYYADVLGSRQAGLVPVLLDPDGLFPEADCTVIRSIQELPGLLSAARLDRGVLAD